MKKGNVTWIVRLLVISIAILCLNSTVWAQLQKKPVLQKSQLKAVPAKPGKLPDLVVTRIELTIKCKIKVTIKNQGKGGVPSKAYDPLHGVIIQATAGNAGWGGYHLSMIDPARKLKRPGASVSYVGFKRALKAGENLTLKVAILDPNNTVKESNERNNTLTRRLSCKKQSGVTLNNKLSNIQSSKIKKGVLKLLPDLTVTDIKLDNRCKILATLKNLGPGPLPDEIYQSGVGRVRFYVGQVTNGYTLAHIDVSKKLKMPGGTLTIKPPGTMQSVPPGQTQTVKVFVDAVAGYGSNPIKEINENNNELTKTLSCSSAGTPIPVFQSAIPETKIPVGAVLGAVLTSPLPLQITRITIGSDAAGNCFARMYFNQDVDTQQSLNLSKVSFSNRSQWDEVEWHLGNPKLLTFASFSQGPTSSTCTYYPCSIHVYVNSSFVKNVAGRFLDGDYDDEPGGDFVQDITVNSADGWGDFQH